MRCPSNWKDDMPPAYTPAVRWRRRLARRGSVGALVSSHSRRRFMAKQPRILAGETAAITGAARGIGRATAEAFLRQGMRVAVGDLDLEAARQTASELGGSAVALPLDVTDRASFTQFLD